MLYAVHRSLNTRSCTACCTQVPKNTLVRYTLRDIHARQEQQHQIMMAAQEAAAQEASNNPSSPTAASNYVGQMTAGVTESARKERQKEQVHTLTHRYTLRLAHRHRPCSCCMHTIAITHTHSQTLTIVSTQISSFICVHAHTHTHTQTLKHIQTQEAVDKREEELRRWQATRTASKSSKSNKQERGLVTSSSSSSCSSRAQQGEALQRDDCHSDQQLSGRGSIVRGSNSKGRADSASALLLQQRPKWEYDVDKDGQHDSGRIRDSGRG
jgi:hypothetical protein